MRCPSTASRRNGSRGPRASVLFLCSCRHGARSQAAGRAEPNPPSQVGCRAVSFRVCGEREAPRHRAVGRAPCAQPPALPRRHRRRRRALLPVHGRCCPRRRIDTSHAAGPRARRSSWSRPRAGQDAVVAKDPRTTRETSFRGPARVRPCDDASEESWVASGQFESAVGPERRGRRGVGSYPANPRARTSSRRCQGHFIDVPAVRSLKTRPSRSRTGLVYLWVTDDVKAADNSWATNGEHRYALLQRGQRNWARIDEGPARRSSRPVVPPDGRAHRHLAGAPSLPGQP